MSGIEIAGLVLGAFPLAIEGIKAYSNGMKTIKDIKNYQQILCFFARELSVEKCKYKNTLLEVLREFVDAAEIQRMMSDLKGDGWDDEHFQSQLKDRLRPADETLENWLYVARELNDTLVILVEKFKLGKSTRKFDPGKAWDVGMLSSYRTEQIAKIRQLNADLDQLANGGRKSSLKTSSSISNTPIISGSLITYHKRIQCHAKSLYSTLSEMLKSPMCKCGLPHSAHLELKVRSAPPTKRALSKSQKDLDIHGPNQFLTFNLIFSQNSGHKFIWQEFQLEPNREPPDNHLNVKGLSTPRITLPAEGSPSSSSSSIASTASERGRSVPIPTPQLQSLLPQRSPQHLLTSLNHKWKKFKGKISRTPSPKPATRENPVPTALAAVSRPYPTRMKKKKTRFANGDESGEDDEVNNIALYVFSGNLPTIPCFCTTLATCTTIHHPNTSPKCVGLLVGTDKNEHRVWTPPRLLPKPARLVSLADLITTFTNINTPSRKNRLVLGLKLISSTLQLNTTQWLTERWEAKDILFPEAGLEVAGKYRNILSRPFVYQSFNNHSTAADPDSQEQPANKARAIIGCNQSLYSLGIILLEIWHWQTFSSLHSSSAGGMPEMLFAFELSDKLFDDAGEQYAMAVRRCIRGLDMPGTDLEQDSFRKRVYQDIWGMLLENLKRFSGGNISEIIGGE